MHVQIVQKKLSAQSHKKFLWVPCGRHVLTCPFLGRMLTDDDGVLEYVCVCVCVCAKCKLNWTKVGRNDQNCIRMMSAPAPYTSYFFLQTGPRWVGPTYIFAQMLSST